MGVVNLSDRWAGPRAHIRALTQFAERCAQAASEDGANPAVRDIVTNFAYGTPDPRGRAA
jgi:hypothetical protein